MKKKISLCSVKLLSIKWIFTFFLLTAAACQPVAPSKETDDFTENPETSLSTLQASDIKQIQKLSITGGNHPSTSQMLSQEEISAFADWLHQLHFLKEIPREEALSSGAVTYYHISLSDGDKLTISPGEIFQLNEAYYQLDAKLSTVKPPC